MTEILWFRLLNPNGSCQYRGRPRLVLVNRLEGLSLPKNNATINWPARHDLVVDRAVKLPTQTNYIIAWRLVGSNSERSSKYGIIYRTLYGKPFSVNYIKIFKIYGKCAFFFQQEYHNRLWHYIINAK